MGENGVFLYSLNGRIIHTVRVDFLNSNPICATSCVTLDKLFRLFVSVFLNCKQRQYQFLLHIIIVQNKVKHVEQILVQRKCFISVTYYCIIKYSLYRPLQILLLFAFTYFSILQKQVLEYQFHISRAQKNTQNLLLQKLKLIL